MEVPNYKQYRKTFIAFVNWYAAEGGRHDFAEDVHHHVKLLHGMWRQHHLPLDLQYFMTMKEHHSHIGCEAMQNIDAFKKYIEAGLSYRVALMAHLHQRSLTN